MGQRIATIEKDSGFIVAKDERFDVSEIKKVASCAEGIFQTPFIGELSVNIFTRPVSDGVTNVQVNTQILQKWSGIGGVQGFTE